MGRALNSEGWFVMRSMPGIIPAYSFRGRGRGPFRRASGGDPFFGSLIYLISRALLMQQSRITAETLWAAVNVYVLVGMMFAFLYSAVLTLAPAAFSGGILDEGWQALIGLL